MTAMALVATAIVGGGGAGNDRWRLEANGRGRWQMEWENG